MLILLLAGFAMYLPGFATLPPMDRDEPRFAQASKQMLETGDAVAIRYQDEARNKKPVGIYWLQAASVAIGDGLGIHDARRTIWLYRLPSLIGAIAAVLGTYWAALAITTQAGAFLAALMLASTVLLTVEAHLAKTDAVLLATVVFAMGSLARIFLAARTGRVTNPAQPPNGLAVPAIFWGAIAIGLLVKGPITPMVPAFACIVLCVKERSASWLKGLRVWPGLALTLLIVLPWFVLILLRTNGAFLADSVGHDMLGKVANAQEAHGAPPGTYLAAFWGTGWPMTPFVALAIPAVWRRRAAPAIAFCLAWLVPTWLLFELVSTKLPHYVLPVYPALAILAAAVLMDRDEEPGFGRKAQGLVFGLVALMPLGLVGVLAAGRGLLWDSLPWSILVLGVLVASGLLVLASLAARMIGSGDLAAAVLATTGAALLAYVFVLGRLLAPDAADRLFLSNRLAAESRSVLAASCPSARFASVGNHEPSLVFLTGTDLYLTDPAGAAEFLVSGPCRGAFVERRAEPAFAAALGDKADVRLVERVTGTAINGAKSLDIGIYVRQEHGP